MADPRLYWPATVYQWATIACYVILLIPLVQILLQGNDDPDRRRLVVAATGIIVATLVIAIWRLVYTVMNGIKPRADHDPALLREHLGWTAQAFIPERTALAAMLVLILTGFFAEVMGLDLPTSTGADPSSQGGDPASAAVDALRALAVTGMFVAAVITSPHHLPAAIAKIRDGHAPQSTSS